VRVLVSKPVVCVGGDARARPFMHAVCSTRPNTTWRWAQTAPRERAGLFFTVCSTWVQCDVAS